MKNSDLVGEIRKEFSAITELGTPITITVGRNQHSSTFRPSIEGCFDKDENQIIHITKKGPGKYEYSFKTNLDGWKYFKVEGFEAAIDYLMDCIENDVDYSKNDYGA